MTLDPCGLGSAAKRRRRRWQKLIHALHGNGAPDRSDRRARDRDVPYMGKEADHLRRVGVEVDNTLPHELDEACTAALLNGMLRGEPVVIRGVATRVDRGEIHNEWTRFLRADSETYMTNQGPSSDGSEGSTCPGFKTARSVWNKAWRIETELEKGTGRGFTRRPPPSFKGSNPVHRFLEMGIGSTAVSAMAQLQGTLQELARRVMSSEAETVHPAFITGLILKGIRNGDACNTHEDDYDNIMHLVLGRKVVYLAPHETFADATVWGGAGAEHERLKARPLDPTAADTPEMWRKVELGPGDALYLPRGWWHAVLSEPRTVMTNIWTRPRDPPGQSMLRADRCVQRGERRTRWLQGERKTPLPRNQHPPAAQRASINRRKGGAQRAAQLVAALTALSSPQGAEATSVWEIGRAHV